MVSFVLEVLVEVSGFDASEVAAAEAAELAEFVARSAGGVSGFMISFGGLIVWMVGLVVPVFAGNFNGDEGEIDFSAAATS